MTKKKNQQLYKKKVIGRLYFNGALSCAALSHGIGKSFPVTLQTLAELVNDGYVVETGYAVSTGGRRPQIYSLRKDTMYIVSVFIEQFVTRIAIMDLHNNYISDIHKFELDLHEDPEAIVTITEEIQKYLKQPKINSANVAGIGIGMPVFTDVLKGIDYSFQCPGKKSISQYVSERTGLQVFLDNDSRMVALAEMNFGILKDKRNAMVINIGWNIGLGLILNGELFRGQNGFVSDLSHIPIFFNNKLCSCGKAGCLETEATLKAVAEKVNEGLRQGKLSHISSLSEQRPEQASDTIINAARKGDNYAIEILSQAGYSIGRAVAMLVHVLNPEMIVVSGRGSRAGKLWEAPIQQALNEYCTPELSAGTAIRVSALGDNAGLIGGAALVMEHFEENLVATRVLGESFKKAEIDED